MKELAVYTRVSSRDGREDERYHSPAEQDAAAREYARRRELPVDGTYHDENISGAVHPNERPRMRELLDRIRAGEVGGIVAFSIDRLSREPAHGEWLVSEVTAHGGIVVAPDMPEDLTSPTDEFQFAILLNVARLYRRQAGARFASAKERAILNGIPVGPVPIGYRQRDDRRIEIDPDTAPVVREIFERRARGEGWTPLARLLDETTGRVWTTEAVRAIIRRRIYATGHLEYGDLVSEWEAEPTVDEPLWHAAQNVNPRPRRKRNPDSPWILTGLLRCDSCRNSMGTAQSSKRQSKGGPVRRRYACRNRACPSRVSVHAGRAERYVVQLTFAVGDELQTRAAAPDLGALEEALAKAELRYEQARSPEARDALGPDWPADVKARRLERDEAAAALGAARAEAGVEATEFRLREVWDDLGPADRRAALSMFWKAIYVSRRDGGTSIRVEARRDGREVEVALPEREDA